MSIEQLISFTIFAFVSSASPGPNNILLTNVGANLGFKRGIPTLLGIIFGFTSMIFIVTVSLGEILIFLKEMSLYIRYIGLTILIWIAWKISIDKTKYDQMALNEVEIKRSDYLGYFIRAFLFQWVNPKAWVVIIAAIAAYYELGNNLIYTAMVFSIVFFFVAFVGCLPWLVLGSFLRSLFIKRPKIFRLFNITMAMLLIITILPSLLSSFK